MKSTYFKWISLGLVLSLISESHQDCENTLTTVSGRSAPAKVCKNKVLFMENFDRLDFKTWKHEVNLEGDGNGEFQWYTSHPRNAFVRNGILSIKPTLTTDLYPDLTTCNIRVHNCTTKCDHKCSADHIGPPIQSARLISKDGFAFKYGRVEIRAKLPTGNWLRPAIRLVPLTNDYGKWPRSGEISVMEARGNWNLEDEDGVQIGLEQFSSWLHFGTENWNSAWTTTNMTYNTVTGEGLNGGYHLYKMDWSEANITLSLDDDVIGTIATEKGFFKRGNFIGHNPWEKSNSNAPFDKKFYFVLTLAVGGKSGFFPDNCKNSNKPWHNEEEYAAREFWNKRERWMDTWNFNEDADFGSAFQIDYIKVTAL